MKIALIILVLALAGGGVLAWKEVAPVMTLLQEKDPESFAAMLVHAKTLDFDRAMKSFNMLEKMTYEQVLTVRYLAMKKKVQEDDEHRLEQREQEYEARVETRELKKEERQDEMQDLMALSDKIPRKVFSTNWDETSPWEKGLLLREKCIKYLNMEKSAHRGIDKIHKLPRMAPLLDRPRELSLTVPEICEEFVPISHDEIQVVAALDNLKNKIGYFFFVQLLDEIGVPRQDVFTFPAQLDRMTTGYAGS
ncbi:hypothetical protein MNBD_NITROSPINAE03-952 [hydrothermal vent metagenome]|uniref:Uncharacterized protein n=1 Tax=hydrothermal vent metagenome TaxID=652676 RepID=A0A3B1CFA4_9ZZZZ